MNYNPLNKYTILYVNKTLVEGRFIEFRQEHQLNRVQGMGNQAISLPSSIEYVIKFETLSVPFSLINGASFHGEVEFITDNGHGILYGTRSIGYNYGMNHGSLSSIRFKCNHAEYYELVEK